MQGNFYRGFFIEMSLVADDHGEKVDGPYYSSHGNGFPKVLSQ
jgi:hypothetical protein